MEAKQIRNNILGCVDCPLYKFGYGKVPGSYSESGPSTAAIIIDFPSHPEGRIGVPLVDKVGELMNPAIDMSGLDRNDLAILFSVKCCTPKNRFPIEYEAILCREWLAIQLAFIKPKLILAMGELAISSLTDTNSGLLGETDPAIKPHLIDKYRKIPILTKGLDNKLVMMYVTHSPNIKITARCDDEIAISETIVEDIMHFGAKYKEAKNTHAKNGSNI